MKKILAILLVSLLVLSGCSSSSKGKTLTVAAPDRISGDFVSGFSNGAYDAWVMRLIGNLSTGASTHYVDRETNNYTVNPTVVEKLDIQEDESGNKTYSYTIKDGLKWSDGQPITAKDYVFGLLFRTQAGWQEVATVDSGFENGIGYKEYLAGETNEFAGVKYIDDKNFQVTLNGEDLPYFYETTWAAGSPDPAHVWMPEFKLNATGNGFDNTPEELAAAFERVSTQERFKPTVTSGPYKFFSFEDNTAQVVLNENYAGNFEGKKPTIEKIVVRVISADVQVQSISNGEIDIAPGVIEAEVINKSKDADLPSHTYPRNGYGKMVLKTQQFPTDSKEVRQAIGFLLNRQEFVDQISGGYAKVVNGPYGLSQWFYKDNEKEINDRITHYTYNLEEAGRLLDEAGFKYEEDGVTPFDASKAGVDTKYFRHNSEGKQLSVKHFGTDNNEVSDLINSQLVPAAQKVGMNFTMDKGDFPTLLNYIYDKVAHDYNSFNLATSFTAIYDQYTSAHSAWADKGTNQSNLVDDEIDALIEKMRRHEPSDRDGFATDVVDYIVKWNDVLPEIPLYSNEYHDIHAKRVKGMEVITPVLGWEYSTEYLSVE